MNAAERQERNNLIIRLHHRDFSVRDIASRTKLTARQVQRVIASEKEASKRDECRLKPAFPSEVKPTRELVIEWVDALLDSRDAALSMLERYEVMPSHLLTVRISELDGDEAREKIIGMVTSLIDADSR